MGRWSLRTWKSSKNDGVCSNLNFFNDDDIVSTQANPGNIFLCWNTPEIGGPTATFENGI